MIGLIILIVCLGIGVTAVVIGLMAESPGSKFSGWI